jgi:hypothetical protein
MEKHLERMMAIEKIDRSINECQSLDQLTSTEHFLTLYYALFSFEIKYFRYEWNIDTKLKNRKKHLAMLEGVDEKDIILNKEKNSLKRLNAYTHGLSNAEMKAEWGELRPQLEGVDFSMYPELFERVAFLRLPAKQKKQGVDFLYKTLHKIAAIS